jgi:anti-repressor protein
MSNELTVFKVNQADVRTVLIDNEPWFVAKDVCSILGYANASKALEDHVDSDDKLNNESLASLGQRGGWIINESGLYNLILRSNKPEAKAFNKGVTWVEIRYSSSFVMRKYYKKQTSHINRLLIADGLV